MTGVFFDDSCLMPDTSPVAKDSQDQEIGLCAKQHRNVDLSASHVREMFDYDRELGILVRKKKYRIANPSKKDGYIRIRVGDSFYSVHRLIWLYVHGEWPSEVIDHINGNRWDNRIENLRATSQRVNMQNQRHCMNTSQTGLLGVHPHQGKFVAQITTNEKIIHLGVFDFAIDGHNAYVKAKRQLHEGCTI